MSPDHDEESGPEPVAKATAPEVSRREVFRIGLGAAAFAAAAGVTVAAAARTAEASPTGGRPVFVNAFRVTVGGVEVPGVIRAELAPVRVNLRRSPTGDVEYDYAEASVMLRLVADARYAGPLWDWYEEARQGGQPPAREVVVEVLAGAGRNLATVLTVRAPNAFVERFEPASPAGVHGTGLAQMPTEAYDIRCPIGPSRLTVEWPAAGGQGTTSRWTRVAFAAAGATPAISFAEWTLAVGGAVVLDTGYVTGGPTKLPLGASTERFRLVLGMRREDVLPDPLRAHLAAIFAGAKPDAIDIDVITPTSRGRKPRTVRYRNVFLEAWELSALNAGAADERAYESFDFLASDIEVDRPS